MEGQTDKMAEEIAHLREEKGMTFKAIGEKYQLSPAKVSYLYRDFLRRRRIIRYYELHEQQNQIEVKVKMTLGELVVLQRILTFYKSWEFRESSRRRMGNPIFKEPDSVTAEYLSRRFLTIEREKRKEAQENKYPAENY